MCKNKIHSCDHSKNVFFILLTCSVSAKRGFKQISSDPNKIIESAPLKKTAKTENASTSFKEKIELPS